jgi:hypothetical protein
VQTGHCHVAERVISKGQMPLPLHRPATATYQCASASALKIRKVEVALQVEGVVDGGVGDEKPLRGGADSKSCIFRSSRRTS